MTTLLHPDKKFEEKVLPRYFKEKYESFRCLLEQWGFLKLSKGQNRGCWYQSNFVYGDRSKIHRITKKEFMVGMPEYLGFRDEPDFMALATDKTRINAKRTFDKIETLTTAEGGAESKPCHKKASKPTGLASSSSNSEETPSRVKREKTGNEEGNSRSKTNSSTQVSGLQDGGCSQCGRDDDHPKLLLCESCDNEIHIYCLNPPLDSVPEDDWYCGK